MKTITLKEAHQILLNCSAAIWNDNFLTYPSVADLTGEDEIEFCYLSGVDEEGQIFSAKFREGNNRSVKVVNSSMFLIDDEGEEVQISILIPASLSA